MNGTVILLWALRLPCWPFDVEGQGTSPAAPPVESSAAAGTAQTPPSIAPPSGSPSSPATSPVRPAPPVPSPPGPVPPRPPARPLPAGLPQFQEARYDIKYGVFGTIGGLTFSVGGPVRAADGSSLLRVRGAGQGSILGLGKMRRTIEIDFDPGMLQSRRWTIQRAREAQPENGGTFDSGIRGSGGSLQLDRAAPGQPPTRQTVTFTVPTSDPLGLLWRLRTAPPAAGQTETVQLLDGLALWRVRVTTAPAREILAEGNRTAIRLDGDVAPIFYDGQPDPDRPTRSFSLWLSDAADHLPLRLEVPVGIADVVMSLVETRRVANVEATQPPEFESNRVPRSAPPPAL